MAREGKLLVFARAPVAGQAKTRLEGALGPQGAADLQAKLIRHTLGCLTVDGEIPVELWCSPDRSHPLFARCAADYGVFLKQQQGDDLGARMAHAFAEALNDHDWAIVVGTDCPKLTVADVKAAGDWLKAGLDAVLGPAEDGGYYLLGLRRRAPSLFRDIQWGRDNVLSTTRERLRELNWQWSELRVLRDLDRPQDLEHFEDWVESL